MIRSYKLKTKHFPVPFDEIDMERFTKNIVEDVVSVRVTTFHCTLKKSTVDGKTQKLYAQSYLRLKFTKERFRTSSFIIQK